MNKKFKSALVANHRQERDSRQPATTYKMLASALIVSTAMLGGCASYQRDHMVVGSTPSDYRTAHPIVVSQNDITQDIPLTSNTKSLSMRDQNLVKDFASKFRRAGAKSMKIMVPSGSRNEMAARRLAHQAKKMLQKSGVPARAIHVISYQAADHGDAATLRMAYTDLTAQVPTKCGKWEEDIAFTPENRNYGNYGCATQNNLAQIVANPADLVGPRAESEIDAERRNNVISDWRDSGHSNKPSLGRTFGF